MGKLVLIDGFAILHRAFHALPPLTTKKGEPISAVYGLVSMLLRVVSDLKPSHLVVCFDEKAKTFRHQEFEGYQAQRPKMDEGLESQLTKARAVLEAFNIPIYSKAGFEADDLLGTFAFQVEKNSQSDIDEVVIVTGDRDLLQLVGGKTKIYMPVVGLSQGKLYGENEVIEKMGVKPVLIPDYKALAGDFSDNYQGVPGVGPKTAVSLLNQYQSVDDLFANLDKITPKLAEKLKQGQKSAEMSHKLATIVKDVPVKLNLKEASRWKINSPKVLALFDNFGFKTLSERVKKVGQEIDQAKQMTLV